MFLSHVSLSTKSLSNPAVQALLRRGVYGEHQLLCRLFGGRRDGNFLFRRLDDGPGMQFYTLSLQEPESAAADQWDWTSKPFQPILREGQRLTFSVRVNPTVNRVESSPDPATGKRRHKRRDLIYESLREQRTAPGPAPTRSEIAQACGEAWLYHRLLSSGFRIDEAAGGRMNVLCKAYRQHRVHKNAQPITISTLDCEGVGTVIDPGAFEALLPRGLGPAKGFGCGLMLIKPA